MKRKFENTSPKPDNKETIEKGEAQSARVDGTRRKQVIDSIQHDYINTIRQMGQTTNIRFRSRDRRFK